MSEQLIAEAAKNGIWTLLAVALLIYTIKSNHEREERIIKGNHERERESAIRENKLMDHLDRTNESHKEITESNRQLAESMKKLESKMDEGLSKVWERIDIIGRG